MKKFSLILLLLLALSLTLTACTQNAATTETVARWEDGERHVFNISKVDWDASSVTVDGTEFVKNPRYVNENLSAKDEIVPEDVGGTYTMEIALQNRDTECVYTTEQVLYAQYETETLQNTSVWAQLAEFVVDPSADALCPLEAVEGLTILRSQTTNTVTFKNEATQRPISSTNKIDGFYLGKIAQTITHVNYSTQYDWENKKVTVVSDGKEVASVALAANAKLIDSNQILLYARSLDKVSGKMQDNPSVQVFSALDQKTYTAKFSYFQHDCKTLLVGADGQDVPVNVNFLSVIVDNSVLLSQFNLPDTINKDAALDSINNATAGSTYNKYTTVRFRVGNFDYELQAHEPAVLEAITVKSSAAEEE